MEATGLPDDLIGLAEACKLLPGTRPGKRLHISTIFRWAATGKLPSWRVGKRTFVSRSDVRALARPTVPPVQPVSAAVRSEEHRRAVTYLKEKHGLG